MPNLGRTLILRKSKRQEETIKILTLKGFITLHLFMKMAFSKERHKK